MRFSRLLLYILTIIFLSSCGEDRTYEYAEKRANDIWIYQTMKDVYLWNKYMPDSTENAFFASPNDFLKKFVFKGSNSVRADIFSYVDMMDTEAETSDYLDETSTYGFDFELITNPLNDKKKKYTYARVLFVRPNSPAYEAGLKRGDWISKYNDIQINKNNYGYLMQGEDAVLSVQDLVPSADTLVWSDAREISLAKSRKVENNPFYLNELYNVGGKKIAYLIYNECISGPNNNINDTEYLNQMKQIFSNFKNESPDAFILDLRYNAGGYLSCAQQMASMLAPETALGKSFANLIHNENHSKEDSVYYYLEDLAQYNLNLKKIYIITSNFTASAAESIINCLVPYMGKENVITIGETTVGNNVYLGSYTKPDLSFVIHPVIAYIQNADNTVNYLKGIAPDYKINEREYYKPLLPLGDVNELLLKNTLSLIITGNAPDATIETTEKTSSSTSSILYKSPRGIKIR